MDLPENELESMVIDQIHIVKQQYVEWTDPHALARALEITITDQQLGADLEGAAFGESIVLNPTKGVKARRRFTLYHEIVHHLIKRDDQLYSILHDQYRSDEDLRRIIERLCNIGAAEFILPRGRVLAAIEADGFSITLVRALSRVDEISLTAACVQLVLCAKHKCIAVVCKMSSPPEAASPKLFDGGVPRTVLQIDTAVSSSSVKYRIARGTVIPKRHLFYEALDAADGDIVHGAAPIPFSNSSAWEVKCEAMRIRRQIFGLFHIEPPPVKNRYQLQLF